MNKNENKANLVDMDSVLEQAKKYEEIEPYTMSDGADIEFYPYFAKDKIDNVIRDLQNFASSEEEEGKSFVELINSSDEQFIIFVQFLMVKEFTHFGEQMKDADTPSKLFPYFEALIKTGYLAELVDEAFIPEEMDKVFKQLANISAAGAQLQDFTMEFVEALDRHKGKIENMNEYRNFIKEK